MNRILSRQYYGRFNRLTKTISVRNFSGDSPQFVHAGFGKVVILLAPFITVGGVASYAKHDDDFRKMLIKNVPSIEQPLKFVLGEENPFQGITDSFKGVTDTFDGISKSVTGLFRGDSSTTQKDSGFPSKLPENRIPPITRSTLPPPEKSVSVPMPTISEKPVSSISTSSSVPLKKTAPSPQAPVQKPAPVVPYKLPQGELEKSIEVAATIAVQEYNKAISILKSYNDDVKRIVDDAIEKNDNTLWSQLRNKTKARNSAVEQAEKSAEEAFKNIREFESGLQSNTNISSDIASAIKRNVRNIQDHIESARMELIKAKDLANVGDQYWKKVETARNYFVDEMQALFPGIDLSTKKLDLSKDELDLFIIHAYSHVIAYQKELQKLQTEGETKLRRAIESLRGDDQTEALKTQLEFHIEKQKRELAIENQKKIFQVKAEAEKELRLLMKRQAAAHSDHLEDAVNVRVNEAKRKYERDLEDNLTNEKAKRELQVASMVGKWKGMNDALKARADSDSNAKRVQELWSACISLWNTVKHGDPTKPWQERIRPLKNEISTIKSAATDDDNLVTAVLKTIPEKAENRGVFSEDALKERFFKVEKLARRLALVPSEGARLPTYLLSYIQSMFIISHSENISRDEINNAEFDFSKLDTYDILGRARYWLDHGNISQAVKYMNLLNGASHKIASEWIDEARIYLETQQAINTLMAYAESRGY